nr:nucleoside phosphorylase [Vibrio stylophorae]
MMPHLAVTPDDIPALAIVCGEPNRVNRLAVLLEQPKLIAENREYRIMRGTFAGQPVVICSTGIGAPSALIALEELRQCGVEKIIRVGSAGALQPNINLGELVVVEAAVRDDGGSKAYVDAAYPASADPSLQLALAKACQQIEQSYHCGIVRSHDSFYTDQEDQLCEFWHQKGVLAADMETAALLTVGRLRGLKMGAILNNVVLYQADVQEGVSQYVDADTLLMNAEKQAGRAALIALTATH